VKFAVRERLKWGKLKPKLKIVLENNYILRCARANAHCNNLMLKPPDATLDGHCNSRGTPRNQLTWVFDR
jgi:hypothetical protein